MIIERMTLQKSLAGIVTVITRNVTMMKQGLVKQLKVKNTLQSILQLLETCPEFS